MTETSNLKTFQEKVQKRERQEFDLEYFFNYELTAKFFLKYISNVYLEMLKTA